MLPKFTSKFLNHSQVGVLQESHKHLLSLITVFIISEKENDPAQAPFCPSSSFITAESN